MTRALFIAGVVLALVTAAEAHELAAGRVDDQRGASVAGALVTIVDADRGRTVTVYTDHLGRFRLPEIPKATYAVTVAHPDHRTLVIPERRLGPGSALALRVELEPDPVTHAGTRAARHWLAPLLAGLPDDDARHEVVAQCTSCHQLGDADTRRARDEGEWQKILRLMARMGAPLRAGVTNDLARAAAETVPSPALARQVLAAPRTPPLSTPTSVVTTWPLAEAGAMLRDLVLHPTGDVYAVDVARDRLHRLDPRTDERQVFALPADDAPLGGDFAARAPRLPANARAHRGPSSLALAPDTALWLTLALENRLARFDPTTSAWTVHDAAPGLFPASLRIDLHGRLWFAHMLSNGVGRFEPTTSTADAHRLPARTWLGSLAGGSPDLSAHVALPAPALGPGVDTPTPTGLALDPDGSVWFAQENADRLGRMDSITRAVDLVETPFPLPRHVQCDAEGHVWVTSGGTGAFARYDPAQDRFDVWSLPTAASGADAASALAIAPTEAAVWLGSANGDVLVRFDVPEERFTVHPLPSGTVVRALAVTTTGTVWGVTGNAPTWHGTPAAFLRLQPDGD